MVCRLQIQNVISLQRKKGQFLLTFFLYKNMKKIIYITLIFLTACSSYEKPVDSSLETQVLLIGNGTEPQDLDPHIVTGVPESKILMALLEGLVIRHPDGKSPLPGVAQSWDISSNGLIYTFNLRKNARWSNGDTVDAHDFVYSWKRVLLPSLGSQYPDMLYDIKNAEPFNKGEITDFKEVGVKAINDYQLQVTLANPAPYFIELLTHYTTRPVHKETIEQYGSIDSVGTKWTRPGNFVGNGPFNLKEWQLNKVIEVEKSNTYWDNSAVKLNGIKFYPIDNVTREDLMFRSGQLHITGSIPQEKIDSYKTLYPQELKIFPYFGTYYYRININKPPLDEKLVRDALSLGLDRKELVDKVAKGGQEPAFSFTPPDKNGYYPTTKLEFNPTKAKQILNDLGYSEENPFPKIELLYNTSEGHQKIAQAIQQMWKTNLGVDIELTNTDWKVYLSRQQIGDYSISRAGWIGDYPDPKTFLDMMVTGRGNNQTGWSNQEYDSLLKKAANATNQTERFNYFNEAEKILMDEKPIIPIYTYTRMYMLHPDVKGWKSNLLDTRPYQNIELIRD